MLLAIDIGNTNISCGLFNGETLLADWRVKTDASRSADEYGILLTAMLESAGFDRRDVTAILVATVVPAFVRICSAMCERYFLRPAQFVSHETPTGVKLDVDYPPEVGADRVVNAVAAHVLYGSPAIVVDFGTATTFDVVLRGGVYIGGAILPGIQISMNALFEYAAQLSRVELRKPSHVIGRNTANCIQSGFYYGYLGQMEELLRQTVESLPEKPTVIATGGLAGMIAGESPLVDAIDPHLTLKGLQIIHAEWSAKE